MPASAGDDGGCGERVAGHVEEGTAQVYVAGHAPKQGGDDTVHEHAGHGHVDHQPWLHSHGAGEPVDCFEADPEGDDDEGSGIDESGHHPGPLIAEGFGMVGGEGLEVDGGKAEQQGQEVRDVVAGLGQKRKRVGAQADDKGHQHIGERGHKRKAKHRFGSIRAGQRGRRVNMHR